LDGSADLTQVEDKRGLVIAVVHHHFTEPSSAAMWL
jgi:hypothetical protein